MVVDFLSRSISQYHLCQAWGLLLKHLQDWDLHLFLNSNSPRPSHLCHNQVAVAVRLSKRFINNPNQHLLMQLQCRICLTKETWIFLWEEIIRRCLLNLFKQVYRQKLQKWWWISLWWVKARAVVTYIRPLTTSAQMIIQVMYNLILNPLCHPLFKTRFYLPFLDDLASKRP